MALPSAKKSAGRAKKRRVEAVEVQDALAARLVRLGKRKWKAKELAAALDKAASSLRDEAVKAHIQANLEQCVQQLHERLLALQAAAAQPAPKSAKRGKKTEVAAAVAEEEEAHKAAAAPTPPASLASAGGYLQLAAQAAEGRPDARLTTTDLLLSRKLPSQQLVAVHVQQLHPEPASDDAAPQQRAAALVAGASMALGTCAALSSEAHSPEDGLRMFAPAVAHLCDASQLLMELQPQQGTAALLQELAQLAGRTLASMHAALQLQQQLALGASNGSSRDSCYLRFNLQQQTAAAAAKAACSAAASICALRTTLRLHSAAASHAAAARQRQQLEAQGAVAAADLRLLAPYAPSGLLTYLAGLAVEEAQGTASAARRFLALYIGVAQQELLGGQDYLSRLAAARKAAAVAEYLTEAGLAACILEAAGGVPVSQGFVGWLCKQPPSSIVSAALAASQRGLDSLSVHLVRECSEHGLQVLLAAMQRGTGGEAPGAGSEGAGDAALDDLLFFVDKEGNASMFGRREDWAMGSDEEDEDQRGGEQGVQLGELPDENDNRRLSVDLGSE